MSSIPLNALSAWTPLKMERKFVKYQAAGISSTMNAWWSGCLMIRIWRHRNALCATLRSLWRSWRRQSLNRLTPRKVDSLDSSEEVHKRVRLCRISSRCPLPDLYSQMLVTTNLSSSIIAKALKTMPGITMIAPELIGGRDPTVTETFVNNN